MRKLSLLSSYIVIARQLAVLMQMTIGRKREPDDPLFQAISLARLVRSNAADGSLRTLRTGVHQGDTLLSHDEWRSGVCTMDGMEN